MPIEEAGRASVEFLGLDFATVSIDQVLAALARRPADAPFAYVVTPNVDHMVRLTGAWEDAGEQARVAAAYGGADLMLCDSRVLSALARWRGVRLPVVPGSDLTARLLDELVEGGDVVAVVGASEDALRLLRKRYPGVDFRQHIPPMGLRTNAAAIDEAAAFVAAQRARFALLAVGSPQQELLAARIKARGGAIGIGLCIGAAIDFIVGNERRAPVMLQKAGLEWAHRLGRNPRRLWRRYLVEGPRIFAAAAKWKPGGR